MPKLLIIKPDDSRDIITVGDTGGYYDPTKIVWDERVDGAMPVDAVPSMVKIDGKLVIDEELLATVAANELLERKALALLAVDTGNDAVITMVIGRRDTEYLQAEKQARAYVDAGYTGDTPPYVHSWAVAKGETERWAADNILETATSWSTIQADMRAKRLKAKEDIRTAAEVNQVDTILTQWGAYIDIIKQQLGV